MAIVGTFHITGSFAITGRGLTLVETSPAMYQVKSAPSGMLLLNPINVVQNIPP